MFQLQYYTFLRQSLSESGLEIPQGLCKRVSNPLESPNDDAPTCVIVDGFGPCDSEWDDMIKIRSHLLDNGVHVIAINGSKGGSKIEDAQTPGVERPRLQSGYQRIRRFGLAKVNFKIMTNTVRIAVLLLTLSCSTQGTSVIDLSQPWTLANNYNENELSGLVEEGSEVAGYAVIKDGETVAEETVSELLPAFSSTKTWSSMVMGILADQGLVSLSDTLGDIFDNDEDWNDIVDAEEKQTLTLEELLTFTSGLSEAGSVRDSFQNQTSLVDVLNATIYSADGRGFFEYLPTNHILARIIFKVSGQTPVEVASDAFAAMGLVQGTDFTWDAFGGVSGSAFGLHYTPRALAKLGLLYLQQGLAAPDVRIVSKEWVTASTTNKLGPDDKPDNNAPLNGYGYQWYIGENKYMAIGGGGQLLAVYPDENMVVSIMTSLNHPLEVLSGTAQAFQLLQKMEDAFDTLLSEPDQSSGSNEKAFVHSSLLCFATILY